MSFIQSTTKVNKAKDKITHTEINQVHWASFKSKWSSNGLIFHIKNVSFLVSLFFILLIFLNLEFIILQLARFRIIWVLKLIYSSFKNQQHIHSLKRPKNTIRNIV